MSSVETAAVSRRPILKSENAKAAPKKTVRFDDGVNTEKCIMRKPLHVLNLASSQYLAESLPDYFFPLDIGNRSTLKEEVSDSIDPSEKFSSSTDVCIVFFREDLPLSIFPEINPNLEKISNPNLKIIQIKVKRNKDFADYIQDVLDEIGKVYVQIDEDPQITNLKKQLTDRAWNILLSKASTEVQRRVALYDLIKLYAAINACPKVIVGYLEKIDEDFKKKEKVLLRQSFRDLGEYDKQLLEYKAKQFNSLIENIKKHYPSHSDQFPEASNSSPNHGVEEQTVEKKVMMSFANKSTDMGDKAAKQQPSESIADADIKKRSQEMEKHTFFYSAPGASGHENKEVNKVEEQIKFLSSTIFQPAQVKSEKVKEDVEKMMEMVKPLSLSRQEAAHFKAP